MSDILKQINNPLFRARGSQSLNQGGITNLLSQPRIDFQNRQSLINPALNLSGASTINDINDEDAKRIGGSIIPESIFKQTKPKLKGEKISHPLAPYDVSMNTNKFNNFIK